MEYYCRLEMLLSPSLDSTCENIIPAYYTDRQTKSLCSQSPSYHRLLMSSRHRGLVLQLQTTRLDHKPLCFSEAVPELITLDTILKAVMSL